MFFFHRKIKSVDYN